MLVCLENLSFGYSGVPILKNVDLKLNENEKVGFIGGNGEGKTTLIKLILGELSPDEGSVFLKNGIKIGYLAQTGGFDSEKTVWDEMLSVFDFDFELISRLEQIQTDMKNADEAQMKILAAKSDSVIKQIAARDSYHVEVKIKTVLNGMGFGARYEQVIKTMSGGEKTRLKLCRLLLEEPDLLILDEPTNHLDIGTLFWLEEYLSSYKGGLFIVSHDRYFLDRLSTRTVELERGHVCSYKGNYTKYKQLKAEKVALEQKEYDKQQEEIAKLKDYIDRNIVRATTAKSALSRVNKLERMTVLEKPLPPVPPPTFSFTFQDDPYERVISAEHFTLAVEGKELIKDGSFLLSRGDRCALVGENGTGKSTLLKFLLSKDERVKIGRFAKIAYYDQENADLCPEDRVLDAFWGRYSLLTQTEARAILARSGLIAEDMEKKVKNLSGGERAKLELAILQAKHGNVLLLDEPTNHLDLPAREALERALSDFKGTLLFVSHDRYFIQALADKICTIENHALDLWEGDYESFLASRKTATKAEERQEEKPQKQTRSEYRSKEERAAEARKKARIREIETRLEAIEAEEATLNEKLAAVAADFEAVRSVCDKLDKLHAESDTLYEEYEKLI